MPQAELDRIGPRGERELVHEGLYAEDVAEGAERAQRRAVYRRLAYVVMHHQQVWELVAGNRVPLRAARGLRWIDRGCAYERLGQLPGGDQHRLAGATGAM